MLNINHKLSLFRGDTCEIVISIIVFQDEYNNIRIVYRALRALGVDFVS